MNSAFVHLPDNGLLAAVLESNEITNQLVLIITLVPTTPHGVCGFARMCASGITVELE